MAKKKAAKKKAVKRNKTVKGKAKASNPGAFHESKIRQAAKNHLESKEATAIRKAAAIVNETAPRQSSL